jgi:hypothetical protein
MGSQWKTAQFWVRYGDREPKCLPAVLGHKETGVNIRVKILGGTICPKIRFEFSHANKNPALQHKGFLDFELPTGIARGSFLIEENLVTRTKPKNKKRNKYAPQDYGRSDSALEDSYFVLKFMTTGGTAYGLDYKSASWDAETSRSL